MPRGFTVAEVKKAFAAEGLPLNVDYREEGTVFLSHSTFILPVGDVEVTVHPPNMPRGTILAVIVQGHKIASARNVVVDFDPRLSSATKARTALARLRKTGP